MIEELKKKFEHRDRLVRVLSKNGYFRAVAIKNSNLAAMAQEKHNLDYIPAYFLAKTLAATSMMSAFLIGEERISLEFSGDGAIKHIFAEALQVGECRGFVRFAEEPERRRVVTLSGVIGEGILKVTRILYGEVEPIVGIVPIQKGDISSDVAYYFAQSEQIGSAVILDTDFDENGKITQSGGIIVQAMPGATQKEIQELEEALAKIESLADDFRNNMQVEEVLRKYLPFDFDVVKKTQVDFFCRCTKEKFLEKLLLLSREEIEDMQKKGQNELTCQFCNSQYILDDKDFDNLIGQIKAKQN